MPTLSTVANLPRIFALHERHAKKSKAKQQTMDAGPGLHILALPEEILRGIVAAVPVPALYNLALSCRRFETLVLDAPTLPAVLQAPIGFALAEQPRNMRRILRMEALAPAWTPSKPLQFWPLRKTPGKFWTKPAELHALGFMADGASLWGRSADGRIRVWSLASSATPFELRNHEGGRPYSPNVIYQSGAAPIVCLSGHELVAGMDRIKLARDGAMTWDFHKSRGKGGLIPPHPMEPPRAFDTRQALDVVVGLNLQVTAHPDSRVVRVSSRDASCEPVLLELPEGHVAKSVKLVDAQAPRAVVDTNAGVLVYRCEAGAQADVLKFREVPLLGKISFAAQGHLMLCVPASHDCPMTVWDTAGDLQAPIAIQSQQDVSDVEFVGNEGYVSFLLNDANRLWDPKTGNVLQLERTINDGPAIIDNVMSFMLFDDNRGALLQSQEFSPEGTRDFVHRYKMTNDSAEYLDRIQLRPTFNEPLDGWSEVHPDINGERLWHLTSSLSMPDEQRLTLLDPSRLDADNIPATVHAFDIKNYVFSPNGRRLAFIDTRGRGRVVNLFGMND